MKEKFIINGGSKLEGRIKVFGAKNVLLPIIAACIMTEEKVIIHNCTNMSDVANMLEIMKRLGCTVEKDGSDVIIDAKCADNWEMPQDLATTMRSSIFMLGPVLGRFRKAVFGFPGGCEIGLRPINLHLKGMTQLNVDVVEECGKIICDASFFKGGNVTFDYPSVGATENVMMAAVLASGKTVINNCALEPEIIELQNFLNSLGAKVFGAGGSTIVIQGVERLHGTEYNALPDRIVAGSYLVAGAITGGDIIVEDMVPGDLTIVLDKIRETGCTLDIKKNSVRIKAPKVLKEMSHITTAPYPGFPTDMQSQILALSTVCGGTTIITENVFENRFKHVPELLKMGANITTKDRTAIIRGVDKLHGANVFAKDLRGGAALVLAGLAALGTTTVEDIGYIDRGYIDLATEFTKIGAYIRRE